MRLLAIAGLALALSTSARGASAQVEEDSTKAAARDLGEQALRLQQQGDCRSALDLFERAEALVPVPILNLHAAQCLEKLGRLVEASERSLRAASLPVDASAPPAYQDSQNAAKVEAARLHASLAPRIAHLRLTVAGQPDSLRIDGHPYPVALVGTSIPMDPGAHHVAVSGAGGDVTLGEGEEKSLALVLPHPEAVVAVRAIPPPVPPRSPLRVIGVVSVVAGAASLVAGAIAYAFADYDSSQLDAQCPNRTCDVGAHPELASSVATYDATRTASAALFIAGAALAAAGVTLVLVAPRRSVTVALVPFGVAGTF